MTLIIDADAHFAEPLDLWEKYIEPKYRERAFRVELGKGRGQGKILIDGKLLLSVPICLVRAEDVDWQRTWRYVVF